MRRKHCGVVDPKHAWKLHAREPSDPVAIRGWKAADRWEKAMSYKAHRHGNGASHSGIVPRKRSNAGGSRVFPISRRAAQRGAPARVPARSAAHVVVADSAAVKEPAGPWNKSWDGSGASFRTSKLCVRILTFALRGNTSKVRTVCVRSARTDLCGGCRATGIPTATGGSPDPPEGELSSPAHRLKPVLPAGLRPAVQFQLQ